MFEASVLIYADRHARLALGTSASSASAVVAAIEKFENDLGEDMMVASSIEKINQA